MNNPYSNPYVLFQPLRTMGLTTIIITLAMVLLPTRDTITILINSSLALIVQMHLQPPTMATTAKMTMPIILSLTKMQQIVVLA